MSRFQSWILENQGTSWSGESELWTDPAGNDGQVGPITLRVVADGISYQWRHEDAWQTGELRWDGETLRWKDSWHQSKGVVLAEAPGHGSLLAAEYGYEAGPGAPWYWRLKLAERPDGTLVLQMINIAPWGEEGRAVRSLLRRAE